MTTQVFCSFCNSPLLRIQSRLKKKNYCSRVCKKQGESPERRFWSRVIKGATENDCWDWNGAKDKDGYAIFNVNRKGVKASRFSYELHYGPLSAGYLACHNCPGGDNTSCTNPLHLWAGTNKENMEDAAKKDRTYRKRLTPHQVQEMREFAAANPHLSKSAVARRFDVGASYGIEIIKRTRWTHMP